MIHVPFGYVPGCADVLDWTGRPMHVDNARSTQGTGDLVSGGQGAVAKGLPNKIAQTAPPAYGATRPGSEPGSGYGGINRGGNTRPFSLWVRVATYECALCCPEWRGGYFPAPTVSDYECKNDQSPDGSGKWHGLNPPTPAQEEACMAKAIAAHPI